MAPTVVKALISSFLLLASTTVDARSLPRNNLVKRLDQATGLPAGWTAKGCITDNVGARTFTGPNYQSGNAMTGLACINFCIGKGYSFAGTEYSAECYCGNAISNGGAGAALADCNMACSGAAAEACGGPNRLSYYATGNVVTPTGPTTNPGPAGWGSLGCYTDNPGARTLLTGVATVGGGAAMTIKTCTDACKAGGFKYAGAEYSGECYCGNVFSNGGAPAASGCTMLCNGNQTEYCGGPDRLNVYQAGAAPPAASSTPVVPPVVSSTTPVVPPVVSSSTPPPAASSAPPAAAGWNYVGCYTDNVAARSLGVPMAVPGGVAAMTNALCQTACKNAGYILAGTEYSGECYCDNTVKNTGALAPNGETGCNMKCNGNQATICGGADRLSFYKYTAGTGGETSSSVPPVVVTSTTTPATPAGTGTGTATNLPAGWKYSGCYVDGANGRVLVNAGGETGTMTIEICVNTCKNAGYTIAGVEYAGQCFCDTVVRNGAVAAPEAECNMACSGAPAEKCGGPNRINIFYTGTLTIYQPPASQKTGLPGNWKYAGCLSDQTPRTFGVNQAILKNNNTATNCLGLCYQFGFSAGGMEYGEECFCGDILDVTNTGATIMPEADCNMPCSGDPAYLCGGPNRLSYYTYTGGVNVWQTPAGNAAGKYEYFIPGPVIPLIVTLGINGKFTFVEKMGTSFYGNSTGAYELDPNLAPSYANAWRTMHTGSDVFCSAGLTLPDKSGRQINIGGWSDQSTYGIRLYTPNGKSGSGGTGSTASTNDWQENYAELKLQVGRWYPTAMIMANGSILVIGGEAGSNGAPVPSLELLPKVGPLVNLPWLLRTDPNNLYPFLYVLPGGGIFVQYYNEALIMNEATFAVTKQLPNPPAAFNNFLGGRTYPFEGTAVMFPQVYPYTDLVTIMMCGGSTPGAAYALDNCVSIQPEATTPTWTIERMPSPRVMTCIATLPDGTFLILNGAKQGVAGFGLATLPNHNALLYNPALPVKQRFSIMANTTIDRLYHSEAVLMQDGRVLVSGSDPEDTRFVQEFRVETFTPPYLLTGAAKPTINSISVSDLAYGATTTLALTIPSGNKANIKVSLVAVDSSTHGNSMGQRILFPKLDCATAASCVVTAPPNAHVCPPGWFQLFVMDNGVPGKSVFVRVGGDPGALGNWPPYADFTKPGI